MLKTKHGQSKLKGISNLQLFGEIGLLMEDIYKKTVNEEGLDAANSYLNAARKVVDRRLRRCEAKDE